MIYVRKGDVKEDRQDPVVVCRMSSVWGALLDAFSEWQATHRTCRTVGLVRVSTGSQHNSTGSW